MMPKNLGSLDIANTQMLSLKTELEKAKINGKLSINELIEVCKKYGTMPFAKLARHAFIGTTLMKSLNTEDVLSSSRLSEYSSSIKTILSEMLEDVHKLKNKSFLI